MAIVCCTHTPEEKRWEAFEKSGDGERGVEASWKDSRGLLFVSMYYESSLAM